jgi:hypothetical protein
MLQSNWGQAKRRLSLSSIPIKQTFICIIVDWLIVGWIIYTWPTFSSLKPDLFSDVSSDIESSSSYVNKKILNK